MTKDSKANTPDDAETRLSGVSRRRFIAATGAGVLAANAPVVYGGPAKVAWRDEADVIVVGSGAAAYTAAVSAARRGSGVLMLEKAAGLGGTTIKSGGGWWAPNNHLMRGDGIPDPREDAIRYLARCSFPTLYNPASPYCGLRREDYSLLEAFYDNASVATEELAAMGALEAEYYLVGGRKFLDYYAHFPENRAPQGRCLMPKGRGDGVLSGGVEMIRQLKKSADAMGTRLLLNHRVQQLVLDAEGRVTGVAVTHEGKTRHIAARKAVIFGSGGFTHNTEMAHAFLRGRIFGGCAVPANTGDFVTIAGRAGAALGNMTNAWWSQVVLEHVLASPSVPNNVFNLAGDSSLLVNRYGRRIVNEKATYNERTQSHFVWDAVAGEYPNLLQFFIYDSRTAEDPYNFNSYPVPAAGSNAPHVITGGTLRKLAENIGKRLSQLADRLPLQGTLAPGFSGRLGETVRRFNQFANSGEDEDFHRGKNPIDTFHNDSNGKPNPAMYPLSDKGPYYAIILVAGTLDTKGGPKINARAQVLSTSGDVIPRLYGAGNCIASPAAQAYWAGGTTLGCAITFGYLAGKHAAAETTRNV